MDGHRVGMRMMMTRRRGGLGGRLGRLTPPLGSHWAKRPGTETRLGPEEARPRQSGSGRLARSLGRFLSLPSSLLPSLASPSAHLFPPRHHHHLLPLLL